MILVNPMIQMNSKKLAAFILISAVGVSIAGSVFAYAGVGALLEAKKRAEGFKQDAAAKGICLRIDEISSKTKENVSQKEEGINARIQNKLQEMDQNREKRDNELAEFRTNADEWRDKNYQLLEGKATTDEQKQAVEKFKTAVETAVKIRRESIDTAIDNFRDGVDKARTDHKSSLEGAMNSYQNAVQTAFEKAKNDCENGVDEKTVRTTLRTSLESSKGQLREDKAGVTKFRDTMKVLIDAKKTAFEKAISDFKTAMKAATGDLKKAFPGSDE
jgi:hypothetical protein